MGSPAERPINGKREMTEGLAARILDHVRAAGLAPGTHLTAQELAALFAFRASRSARRCSSSPPRGS